MSTQPKERTAGRELNEIDRRVATDVLGWTEWKSDLSSRADCWQTGNRRSPTTRIAYWHPTRDIGAAMLVVETMQARGYGVSINALDAGGWRVCFIAPGYWGVSAATLALAICLAALAALDASTTGDRGKAANG